jgi:hypothetical protein
LHLSTHYYVLSLGADTNTLYEAFRDLLITIENRGFPVKTSAPPTKRVETVNRNHRHELVQTVDERFDYYYKLEPLHLVVVGDKEMQSTFSSVTTHRAAVIGCIEGDHSATSAYELGQIVWPLIKERMSDRVHRERSELEDSAENGFLVCGLESVARTASKGGRATLLVEDDYRMRGRVGKSSESPVVSTEVDVRESIDDAVDAVIELVLESDGNVVFTPPGSLSTWNRIVLLLCSPERV